MCDLILLILNKIFLGMKVLVTGNLGYVGQVLTTRLIKKNFDVIGCDTGFYQHHLQNIVNSEITIKKDIRDINESDLKDCSAILHLAALSNDPLGEINSSLTHEINFLATVHLAQMAKKAGVERFIYSSSCSTYGVNDETVNEHSSLAPITAYAKSKVQSEIELLKMKNDHFHPIILRNATAYGFSQSLRLDIVVNNLTASAYSTGSVKLLSDGTSWRPLIHVEDMAKAFILCLNADISKISGEVFNVGSNSENYTVKQIAKTVNEIIPNSKIEYTDDASKDSRSYRVNFDKINKILGFTNDWTINSGIKQIYDELKKQSFTETDFKDKKFFRVAYMKWLLEDKIVNKNLRYN